MPHTPQSAVLAYANQGMDVLDMFRVLLAYEPWFAHEPRPGYVLLTTDASLGQPTGPLDEWLLAIDLDTSAVKIAPGPVSLVVEEAELAGFRHVALTSRLEHAVRVRDRAIMRASMFHTVTVGSELLAWASEGGEPLFAAFTAYDRAVDFIRTHIPLSSQHEAVVQRVPGDQLFGVFARKVRGVLVNPTREDVMFDLAACAAIVAA